MGGDDWQHCKGCPRYLSINSLSAQESRGCLLLLLVLCLQLVNYTSITLPLNGCIFCCHSETPSHPTRKCWITVCHVTPPDSPHQAYSYGLIHAPLVPSQTTSVERNLPDPDFSSFIILIFCLWNLFLCICFLIPWKLYSMLIFLLLLFMWFPQAVFSYPPNFTLD